MNYKSHIFISMFCGRKNPERDLTNEEKQELISMLGNLSHVAQPIPMYGLPNGEPGAGISYDGINWIIFVYNGVVVIDSVNTNKLYFYDTVGIGGKIRLMLKDELDKILSKST